MLAIEVVVRQRDHIQSSKTGLSCIYIYILRPQWQTALRNMQDIFTVLCLLVFLGAQLSRTNPVTPTTFVGSAANSGSKIAADLNVASLTYTGS